jgi:hypothetical protein
MVGLRGSGKDQSVRREAWNTVLFIMLVLRSRRKIFYYQEVCAGDGESDGIFGGLGYS